MAAKPRRLAPRLAEDSLAAHALARVDYVDVYATRVPEGTSLEAVASRMLRGPPPRLMRLRDALVRPFGLKTTPPARPGPAPTFLPGQRIGLFRLFQRSQRELLLGEDDKHLDFRVCLGLHPEGEVRLVTLVQFRNLWGRAYFFCIRPFHGFVVRSMLRRASG